MSESQKVFIIQLRHWGYDDERYFPEYMETLKAFRTSESAEVERSRLEQLEHSQSHIAERNPFYSLADSFPEVTSLSEKELLKEVTDAAIPPPSKAEINYYKAKHNWGEWWENLSEEHQAIVRPWLDRVSMHVVVEVPLSSLNVVNEE